jgi:hypothetical protein
LNWAKKLRHCAEGDSAAEIRFSPDRREMILRGILLDHVDLVPTRPVLPSDLKFKEKSPEDPFGLTSDWETWCRQFGDEGKNPYGGLEDQRNAYQKTTVLGNDVEETDTENDDGWHKQRFYKDIGWNYTHLSMSGKSEGRNTVSESGLSLDRQRKHYYVKALH